MTNNRNAVSKVNILSQKEKVFFSVAWLTALLINVKISFMSFCTDSAYCVVMASRLVRGEHLFVEMLEPHQTSAIIPALFESVFFNITGSTEGIVLYLHFCGLIIFGLISFLMIFLLRKHIPLKLLHFMALIFFVFRPKLSNIPDYANMSVALSVLLWIFLLKYIFDKKYRFIALSSFFACCAAMAYPSNMLFFIIIIGCIFFVNRHDIKAYICTILMYALFWLTFLVYVLVFGNIGLFDLLSSFTMIFSSDSHSEYRYSGWNYFSYTFYGLIFCLLIMGISFLVSKALKKRILTVYARILTVASIIAVLFLCFYSKNTNNSFEWFYFHFVVCSSFVVIGFIVFKKNQFTTECRTAYIAGTVISLGTLINTLILTNLSLDSVLGYLSLGVITSLIPLSHDSLCDSDSFNEDGSAKAFTNIFAAALACFIIICFNQFFICSDSSGDMKTVLQMENYIRVGPEKYLVSTLPYCNRVRESYSEWNNYLDSSDSVLIISAHTYELIAYTYSDAVISNYSTISTPSYYENNMLKYWETHPDKLPDVIAVTCWQDEEYRTCPDWLNEYINSNYSLSFSGDRWKFYRK